MKWINTSRLVAVFPAVVQPDQGLAQFSHGGVLVNHQGADGEVAHQLVAAVQGIADGEARQGLLA